MKKIFVVEDDGDIRELIQFLLIELDYEVQAFATAEAFNNSIGERLPDLILLDIMLPDGNGAEMCEHLKSQDYTSSIPILLMSAHVDPMVRKESCADDFIAKPFDIEDLATRIKKQLK